MKRSGHGEKGFTLIELLLVVAILALLAVIAVPQLLSFLTTSRIAAANTEVTSMESAALAYYSDHDSAWPDDSDILATENYTNEEATVVYGFDDDGKVTYQDGAAWGSHSNVIWNSTAHEWQSIWE